MRTCTPHIPRYCPARIAGLTLWLASSCDFPAEALERQVDGLDAFASLPPSYMSQMPQYVLDARQGSTETPYHGDAEPNTMTPLA